MKRPFSVSTCAEGASEEMLLAASRSVTARPLVDRAPRWTSAMTFMEEYVPPMCEFRNCLSCFSYFLCDRKAGITIKKYFKVGRIEVSV